MSSLEKYSLQDLDKEPFLICKDHTLSKKQFELYHHPRWDMLVTHPQPEVSELPDYYESEEYISHTDASQTLFEKLYQLVKSYMIDTKLGWIQKEMPGKGSILDIGAGTGDFLVRAKKRGWKVSGAEPNPKARELTYKKGIRLNSDTSGFASNSFDVITMWHVLEHVPDLEAQFVELKRLLKEDGVLVIAVPNYKSYDAQKYKEHWAAYDVPRHLWHFSGSSIEKLLSPFGFNLTSKKPLVFDSFYVSLLSEKYKSGKINFVKGIYNGLISNLKGRRTEEYSSIAYFLRKSSEKA